MKSPLFHLLLLLALPGTAMAADPAVPMSDFEPRPVTAAGAAAPAEPGLRQAPADDLGLGLPAVQSPAAQTSGEGLLDNEYLAGPQVHPTFQNF